MLIRKKWCTIKGDLVKKIYQYDVILLFGIFPLYISIITDIVHGY